MTRRLTLSPGLKPGQAGYRMREMQAACARRGLTFLQACQQIGVSKAHLTHCLYEVPMWGQAVRYPAVELAERIAIFVGIPKATFFPESVLRWARAPRQTVRTPGSSSSHR